MSLVIDTDTPGAKTFSSFPVGVLFRDSEGDDCVKVDPSGYSYVGGGKTLYPNTLRLSDSKLFNTPGDDIITPYPDGSRITYEDDQ